MDAAGATAACDDGDAAGGSGAGACAVSLPDECLMEVLRCLPAPDLARCQEVCRRWLALGREDALWRALAAARPEFGAFVAARLRPGASPAAAAPPEWHAWYRRRAQGAARWRAAAPRGVTLLEGHLGTVFGVCAHPDAPRALFSAGEDARLRLWDAATGSLAAAVDVPSLQGLFNVHAFRAAADEHAPCFAAACGFNGDVCLLPLRAPPAGGARLAARLTAADLRARFAAVGLDPDADGPPGAGGANLAAALEALRAAEGAVERCAAAAAPRRPGDADADAPPLAGVATPQGPGVLLVGHAAPVVAARDRDGTLATCSFDGSIRLWSVAAAAAAADAADAAAREAAQKADAPPRPRPPPVFSSSLATLSDVPPDAPLGPHEYSVAAVCLPAGTPNKLVRGGNDGLVKVWDLEMRRVTAMLAGHTGWIWCLEAGDDAGNLLLSGATDSAIRGWDMRAPRGGLALRAETLPNAGPVSGLAVRPAEQRVASGSFDGQVRLFDLRMWGRSAAPRAPGSRAQLGPGLRGHTDRVARVAATASYVASASFDTTLRVHAFDDIL